jgi:hypothetical protein
MYDIGSGIDQSLCPFPPRLVRRTCLFRNPAGLPILPKFKSAILERGVRQSQNDTIRQILVVVIQCNLVPSIWFTTDPDLD